MKIVIYVLAIFFISLGIVYFLYFLKKQFLKKNTTVKTTVIVSLPINLDDVEMVVRDYLFKYKDDFTADVIFVDCGLNEEAKKICKSICKGNSNMQFCNVLELCELLKFKLA